METTSLPYKMQIWVPEDLRYDLKALAHAKHTSLQKLVVAILEVATRQDELGIAEAIDAALAAQAS